MKDKAYNDKRLSKYNYGSRKRYSIRIVLLEKRSIFDCAKKKEEVNACAISYLEACYDWKTPELCALVEETIGANRKAIKIIKKVLPRLEHHVRMANGVSK